MLRCRQLTAPLLLLCSCALRRVRQARCNFLVAGRVHPGTGRFMTLRDLEASGGAPCTHTCARKDMLGTSAWQAGALR